MVEHSRSLFREAKAIDQTTMSGWLLMNGVITLDRRLLSDPHVHFTPDERRDLRFGVRGVAVLNPVAHAPN
jgi:hypothetical protein